MVSISFFRSRGAEALTPRPTDRDRLEISLLTQHAMQPSRGERLANALGGAAQTFGGALFQHEMQKERLESAERIAGMQRRQVSAAQRSRDYDDGIVPQEEVTRYVPDADAAFQRIQEAGERGRGSVVRGQRTSLPPIGLRQQSPLEGALFNPVDLQENAPIPDRPLTLERYPVGSIEHIPVPGGTIPVPIEEAPPDPVTGAPRVRLFSRSKEGRNLRVKAQQFDLNTERTVNAERAIYDNIVESYPEFARDKVGAFDQNVALQGGYTELWGQLTSEDVAGIGRRDAAAVRRGERELERMEEETVAAYLTPYIVEGKTNTEIWDEHTQYLKSLTPSQYMATPRRVRQITLDDIEQFRRKATPREDFLTALLGLRGQGITDPSNPLSINSDEAAKTKARQEGIAIEDSVLGEFSPEQRKAALDEVMIFVTEISNARGNEEPTTEDLLSALDRVRDQMPDDNPNKGLYMATMARLLRYRIEQLEEQDPSLAEAFLKAPLAIGEAALNLFK